MKQRIAYIINPVSGTSNKQSIADYLYKTVDKNRYEPEIYFTQYAGDGTRQAKEYARQGFERVVAVGGDGTVNEVATGLLKTAAALGIIPLGSGNGLARHIKMPLNHIRANKIVQDGKIIFADCGTLNGKPFFCTAGTGFDAQVGQRFAQIGRRGFVSYAQASFLEYLHYCPSNYKITVEGKTFSRRAFLITLANASQWGYNAYISPNANLNDGMLDLVIVYPFNLFKAPIIGLRMFTKSIYRSGNIDVIRVREASIEREKAGYVHIDGDPMVEGKILDIKTVPAHLRLIVPDEINKQHFTIPFIKY
ncbi:MAG: diacylglycerol kinase family lipid kinase [Prevotellaceae bacterium]|jgi:YegS/Rv2252/BmrU family lipid kinase|nr:diacylglycerol kinase family lipid kinase [Prevotellaceae bacterium]